MSAEDGTINITLKGDAGALIRELKSGGDAINKFGTDANKSLSDVSDSTVNLHRAMSQLGSQMGVALTAGFAVGKVLEFRSSIQDAQITIDKLRNTITYGMGGYAVAQEIDYLRKTTNAMGLEFSSTAQLYAKFAAAARGTALEGKGVKDVFEAVGKASTVMGLSADNVQGVMLALTQIMSKGTVQSEEIRGQLGERLPGAFQIASRAMGVTTAEFGKLLETGQVMSADFLPKFAAQMEREFAGSFEKASQSAQASMNRLANSWDALKTAIADDAGVGKAISAMNDKVSEATDSWARRIKRMSNASGFFETIKASVILDSKDFEIEIRDAKRELSELDARLATQPSNIYAKSAAASMQVYIKTLDEALAKQRALENRESSKGMDIHEAGQGFKRSERLLADQEAERVNKIRTAMQSVQTELSGQSPNFQKHLSALKAGFDAGLVSQEAYVKDVQALIKKEGVAHTAGNEHLKTTSDAKYALFKASQEKITASLSVQIAQQMRLLDLGYKGGSVDVESYHQRKAALELQAIDRKEVMLRQELAEAQRAEGSVKKLEDKLRAQERVTKIETQLIELGKERVKVDGPDDAALRGWQRLTEAANAFDVATAAVNKELYTQQKALSESIEDDKTVLQMQVQYQSSIAQEIALLEIKAQRQKKLLEQKLQLSTLKPEEQDQLRKSLQEDTALSYGKIAAKAAGLDGSTDQFKDLGAVMREAFATANDGVVRMIDSMGVLVKSGKDYAAGLNAIQALRDKGGESNLATAAKLESALILKTERDQVGAYANMAGAAKSYFKEGSTGYKVMADTEKALRIYQLAMTAKTMGADLAAIGAKVAAWVAGDTAIAASAVTSSTVVVGAKMAEGTASAVAGVANQASGDPYSAFFRMAAMAAAMAALGFAVSGSSSGGVDVAARQAANGTGTVLGDATAKSHSIEEGLKALQDIASPQLDLTSKMLASLHSIDSGIGSLANLVVRTVGLTTGSNLGIQTGTQKYQGDPILNALGLGFINKAFTSLPVVGSLISGLQGLWGKTSTSIADSGLAINGSVSDLKGGSGVRQYADVSTTSSSWFGLSKSTSNSTVYGAVSDDFSKQMGLVFDGVGKSLSQAATILGRDGSAVGQAVANFVVDIPKLSLQGLKGADLQQAINDAISAQSDKIAASAVSGYEDFQKVGEGYFQTLMRVAGGLDQAGYFADKLHIATAKLSDVQNKSGDVAAELVRTSIMDAETVKTKVSATNAALYTSLVSGVVAANGSLLDQVKAGILSAVEPIDLYTSKLSNIGDLMSSFSGSASDMADYYTSLKDAQATMVNMGVSADALNAVLLRSAGGIDALKSSLGTYYDKFYTDAEKNADLTRTTAAKLATAGIKMPPVDENTRAWFRAQIDILGAQDLSIKKNADAYTSVLALAGSVDTLASTAEATAKTNQAWADKLAVMQGKKTQEQINLAADLASTTDEATKANIRQVYAQTASTKAATDGKAALDKAVAAQKTLTQATVDAAQQSVTAFSGLFNLLKTQVNELYNQVDSTAAMNAQAGRAFITQALATANSTGYLPEQAALSDAITAARSGLSSASYKSQFEQDKATLVMASELAQLKDKAGTQLTTAEEQVRIAKKQLVDLDTTVKLMQEQIDASNGINASVLSVAEAIAALQEKLAPAQSTAASTSKPLSSGGISTGSDSLASGSVAARVQDFSGVDKVLATADFGNNKVGAAYNLFVAAREQNLSEQQLADRYGFGLSDVRALFAGAGISAFADGGLHSGGWRLVGEHGPEIEAVGPARYWDASTTQRMLSGAGQSGGYDAGAAAYIASLQEQLKAQTTAFLVMLDEHNRILRKWEGGGLPPTREVNA